ncbi:carbohydrate ABC transporter permease [Streptomyces mirabilis]|uniref:carbohydrate ABC transporter permease n=1 Tax=Streptomyces mirabilis TaxID=68239 RepID=UPI003684E484
MMSTASIRRRRIRTLKQTVTGYAFSGPYLVLFSVVLLLPITAVLVMSFTDFNLAAIRDPSSATFVGLQNFRHLFSDDLFKQAARNTAVFTLFGVPLTLGCGLVTAVLLDSQVARFRSFFRVAYYTPVVTSIVGIAVCWRFVLDPDSGLVNSVISLFGGHGPNWLGSPSLALPSIIVMAVWRNMGFSMVIFLAGLQAIPDEIREAARVEGAGRIRELWSITIPMLRPTMAFAAITTTIGYLNVFEEPFVMTGGGPLNHTLSVSMYMYQEGFRHGHFGYASSIAFTVVVVVAVLTAVQLRLFRENT